MVLDRCISPGRSESSIWVMVLLPDAAGPILTGLHCGLDVAGSSVAHDTIAFVVTSHHFEGDQEIFLCRLDCFDTMSYRKVHLSAIQA